MNAFKNSLDNPSLQTLFNGHPGLQVDQNKGLLFKEANLTEIANQVGTPTWVMSADILQTRYRRLVEAFINEQLNISIHYAIKANGHLAVLDLLAKEGAGADIVSGGELKRALAANIAPAKICFSGVGKTEEELRLALQEHVGQINVESREELQMLSRIAQDMNEVAPICLRINPDVDAGTHHKITTGLAENKFGIAYQQAIEIYTEAHQLPNLKPLGYAVHIGSQITTQTPYRKAFSRMVELITQTREKGLSVEVLDCGGGFGITYFNEKESNPQQIASLMKSKLGSLDIQLYIEPGRWLAGPAGILLSRVILRKNNGQDAAPFIIIDAAMNDLIRPTLYEAWHGILPVEASTYKNNVEECHIVGPVCESGDTFARYRQLPILQPGNIIAILDTGAYGSVMSSTYNARPFAAQVMTKGDQYAIIQQRQSIEATWENEIIPFQKTK